MPYPSTFPALDIPDVDLWTLVFASTLRRRDFPVTKEILISADTGRSYTWNYVRLASAEFGKGLVTSWQWKKGDVLAFYTPNSIDVCFPCH
jgi:4-coumarate--CoA ligase